MIKMTNDQAELIRTIADTQPFAVLATSGSGHPHCSLVAFALTPSLDTGVFATPESTRKVENMLRHDAISLFVDNRQSDPTLLREITGISVQGRARIVRAKEAESLRSLYLAKNPFMRGFVNMPDTVLIHIAIDQIDIVSNFQTVITVVSGFED